MRVRRCETVSNFLKPDTLQVRYLNGLDIEQSIIMPKTDLSQTLVAGRSA